MFTLSEATAIARSGSGLLVALRPKECVDLRENLLFMSCVYCHKVQWRFSDRIWFDKEKTIKFSSTPDLWELPVYEFSSFSDFLKKFKQAKQEETECSIKIN